MSTQIKYLKDENGEIFSPIVSSSSVMMGGGLPRAIYWIHFIIFRKCKKDESNKALSSYGAYALLMTVNAQAGTDGDDSYAGSAGFWQEVATGMMAYSKTSTNSSNADEIPLSWVGHARNDNSIKLRWIRISGGGNAKLQIYCTRTWDKDCNLNFYFRKLI